MNLTKQEKAFADEYVFRYCHGGGGLETMVSAARHAEYELPDDDPAAWDFGKKLLNTPKIRIYVDAEIKRFREIFSGGQRRNLWKYISDFKPGIAEKYNTYSDIHVH